MVGESSVGRMMGCCTGKHMGEGGGGGRKLTCSSQILLGGSSPPTDPLFSDGWSVGETRTLDTLRRRRVWLRMTMGMK